MRRIAACVVLTLLTGQTTAGDFPEKKFKHEGKGIGFLMPSNNVECHYSPPGGTEIYKTEDGLAELSCDRAEPEYLRFVLSEHGKAKLLKDVGEQGCCGSTSPLDGGNAYLEYGRSFREGSFECDSMAMGLKCENGEGHGFFISKKTVKVY